MNKNCFPTWYSRDIYNIEYDFLKENGIKYIFCDLDNTVVSYDIERPDIKEIEWFKKIKSLGFDLTIVSNNNKRRVEKFIEGLDIPCISSARKPFIKKLKKYIIEKNINVENCVFIGDQVITDILVSNRLKIKSILVDPVKKAGKKITFFNRLIDLNMRERLRKRNKLINIERK